jgi:hypothetical protein
MGTGVQLQGILRLVVFSLQSSAMSGEGLDLTVTKLTEANGVAMVVEQP